MVLPQGNVQGNYTRSEEAKQLDIDEMMHEREISLQVPTVHRRHTPAIIGTLAGRLRNIL
jgi:hypothetical protein